MRDIRCVLFDLDDTLHDDTLAYTSAAEEVAREIEAERGIDALALKAAYIVEAETFWKRLSSEQLSTKLSQLRRGMWHAALGAVGIEDAALSERSAVRYNAYRKKHLRLFPGAADLLRGLRARGVRLGLVTNGISETHHEKIALLQIGEYFDAIFLADEVGMVKPDPLLFAHACTKLERPPSRSVMVGDRYERDIGGAMEAGLYTIWMNVHGAALPAGSRAPDATVTTIDEVSAILLGEPTGHAE